jgi:O-succinylbenzoate synthase
MALVIEIVPYTLNFKFDARTSRGPINEHKTWFLKVWDDQNRSKVGYGECAPFEDISIDHTPDFEQKLYSSLRKIEGEMVPQSLAQIENYVSHIDKMLPSVRFGLETALRDLYFGGQQKIFDSAFYNHHQSIDINGLVWMGEKDVMLERLELKVMQGFDCVKLKIGALDFDEELEIIHEARSMIGNDGLSLRVDANGAYAVDEVDKVLEALANYHIHSIEQPIKPGQIDAMHKLCAKTPVPIALDEELVGIVDVDEKRQLLEAIKPQYIVLKPTMLGGFKATSEWIELAEELGIGWWITSALESNIGLNAICQFTSQYNITMPQGLGTGELYDNNIPSPLTINNGCIFWDKSKHWYLNLTERQV